MHHFGITTWTKLATHQDVSVNNNAFQLWLRVNTIKYDAKLYNRGKHMAFHRETNAPRGIKGYNVFNSTWHDNTHMFLLLVSYHRR